jgi:signal transduction histidine kinase
MIIRKSEIEELSRSIRMIIGGESVDIRDNREGVMSMLKNDIHTLASLKNEQVEALQRERDKLKDTLADISHQLKTPLTSMMIMADLLENASPEKRAEFISNIRVGLSRTDWLVSTLLKMAKLDAGAIKLSKELAQAGSIIEMALEPLETLLELKGQTVLISDSVSEGSGISCDKRWSAEALSNIIKNASEHSPAGGEIRVESGGNPICSWISVTDSGPGIEAAKIFKRFEGSTNGFGIGLPLALAVMRGQNGDIEAKGSTFTMKFYK